MVNAIETENESKKEDLIPALAWEFGEKIIRTVLVEGEPWWVAKDVCELLGYKDPTTAVRSHCRDGVQKLHPIIDSLGRTQDVRIIAEPDLLRLIVGSTLPEAVRFEKWVFEVVLPQIRKTGFYMSGSEYQNISEKLIELEKQVQLIKQSSATFNNEQSLIEPLIKQFAENSMCHNSERYPILSLIREEYKYLCDPEKYGSMRSFNDYAHDRLNISDDLAICGIKIRRDRLFKNKEMVWVDIKNDFIGSSYQRTQWQGKWEKAILNINSVQCVKNMSFVYCSHPAIGIPIELFMEYADLYLAEKQQLQTNNSKG